MKGGDRMTRRDLKLIILLGCVILAAVLFGTFRTGIDDLMRDLAQPDEPFMPDIAKRPGLLIAGPATVIDGDTLEIRGQRIRLHGIDAPESGQTCKDATGESYRCGQRAALALSDRIGNRPVTCAVQDTDRYGRVVAICRTVESNLNGWMVLNGHALAYRKYSKAYLPEESVARHQKRGFWAGSFVAPWDWRRGQR